MVTLKKRTNNGVGAMAAVKERTFSGFCTMMIGGTQWGTPQPVTVDIWSGRDRVTAELQQLLEMGPVDRAGPMVLVFSTNANGSGKQFQTSPRPIQVGQAVACLHPMLDRLVYWP
jgi:hypothetical protein